MRTVVVAHGDVDPADRDLVAGAEMVIAADGGAFALERWGITPNLVVGDFDSLGLERAAALGARGATVLPFPAEKAESDLELAMRYAFESGADDIVVLGAFGGRLDHALSNVLMLADPAYRGWSVRAVQGATQLRAVHGGKRASLDGPRGSIVTLLPVGGEAHGVTTHGLRYALADDTLRFGRSRGLSNEITSTPASVSLEKGVLLVIEIHKGGAS
jgi:thiamine pyrophosphokinase